MAPELWSRPGRGALRRRGASQRRHQRSGTWRRLCPSCAHVQPPNRPPPGRSPHYPETPRPRDPVCGPLLPAHLLSQMRCGILTYEDAPVSSHQAVPRLCSHSEAAAPRRPINTSAAACCSRGSFVSASDKIRHRIEAWRRIPPSDGINFHPISSSVASFQRCCFRNQALTAAMGAVT